MWQILIFFYFIFGATSYLLRRILAQKLGHHNRLINSVFFLFFLLPAALILSFFFPHNLNVGALNILLLFGGSIIWPILGIVSFRANREVDVGIFAIITNLSPVFTLVIAINLLHESLIVSQYFGIGLLISSGIIAASSQLHKHNRFSISNIFICLLSAFILGVAVAYERFMLNRIDFGAYLIYGWGSQIIWSVILAGKELKKLPELFNKTAEKRGTLIIWGTTSVMKSITFILALKISGSASIISAASNFISIVVVIAAYFFLKERQHMINKWLAAIVGIIGLLLVTT